MADTVMMKKGGQVRQVPVGKVGKFVDKGFVEVIRDKKKGLIEKGGKDDLLAENKKLKAEVKKLKAELAKAQPNQEA